MMDIGMLFIFTISFTILFLFVNWCDCQVNKEE